MRSLTDAERADLTNEREALGMETRALEDLLRAKKKRLAYLVDMLGREPQRAPRDPGDPVRAHRY